MHLAGRPFAVDLDSLESEQGGLAAKSTAEAVQGAIRPHDAVTGDHDGHRVRTHRLPDGVQVGTTDEAVGTLEESTGPTLRGYIEGLAEDGDLHAVQEGFWERHGLQCGYCTPGMVMAGVKLLEADPDPDEATIRTALKGNLCRCTGYHNIVRAVRRAAGEGA